MNTSIKDHLIPSVTFFVVFFIAISGISIFGWGKSMCFVVYITGAAVGFYLLSMLYCTVFLGFKGIFSKSSRIKYGSILPWLKFLDTSHEEPWQKFIISNGAGDNSKHH